MLVYLLNILWMLTSIFMVLVILIQRGRGGGLVGALGGPGGSSAFGTKAGDVFTRITVGVFAVWLVIGVILVPMQTKTSVYRSGDAAANEPSVTTDPDAPSIPPTGGGEEPPPLPPAKPEAKPDASDKAADKPVAKTEAAKPTEKTPTAKPETRPQPKAEPKPAAPADSTPKAKASETPKTKGP